MGTSDSFEPFFEENRRKLFGAFCLETGNRHDAEEISEGHAIVRLPRAGEG